jgi:hypothetical protein
MRTEFSWVNVVKRGRGRMERRNEDNIKMYRNSTGNVKWNKLRVEYNDELLCYNIRELFG